MDGLNYCRDSRGCVGSAGVIKTNIWKKIRIHEQIREFENSALELSPVAFGSFKVRQTAKEVVEFGKTRL